MAFKKIFAVILAVTCIALLFSGCGKTDATKNVEALIKEIGEVNLDSGDAISSAEAEYKKLTVPEQEKVDNYKKLTDARETYDSYVTFNSDIASIVNAAETAFSNDEFKLSELLAKAAEIKTQYEGFNKDRKALVKDFEKIDAAIEKLNAYVANAEKAAKAYVTAFNTVNTGKGYTVTAVYCIKQIRNENDEYHFFALTYKSGEKETTVYSGARCTAEVSAEAIAARADIFFATKPVNTASDAKTNGNVSIDIAKLA